MKLSELTVGKWAKKEKIYISWVDYRLNQAPAWCIQTALGVRSHKLYVEQLEFDLPIADYYSDYDACWVEYAHNIEVDIDNYEQGMLQSLLRQSKILKALK